MPYTAVAQIGQDFGSALATKPLVIDVSNPVPARDGQDLVNEVASEGGPGLVTAKLLKGARVVRAFNALHTPSLDKIAHRPDDQGGPVGVPIAGDDSKAIDLASRLIGEAGFEPVLIGDLAKGKYLVPGTPLAGQHTPSELRKLRHRWADPGCRVPEALKFGKCLVSAAPCPPSQETRTLF